MGYNDRNNGDKPFRGKRGSDNRSEGSSSRRSSHQSSDSSKRYNREDNDRRGRDDRRTDGDKPYRSFDKRGGDDRKSSSDRPYKSFDKREGGDRRNDERKSFKSYDKNDGDRKKSFGSKKWDKEEGEKRSYGNGKPNFRRNDDRKESYGDKQRRLHNEKLRLAEQKSKSKKKVFNAGAAKRSVDGKVRLNRFMAQAGICSRREADILIKTGVVTINDKVITELGTKVDAQKDVVKYDGNIVKLEGLRYVLLNKPKDFITTSKDPQERKTVMHLVDNACVERIYPVGRLDRQTLGVLLFTNDGDLADKLTHPRNGVLKTYVVETNKRVESDHMRAYQEGVELEDGVLAVDDISYVDPTDKKIVSVTIHSGKNRVVRRLFEHFNYDVRKLDRVDFGGLTKKGLKRGQWRHLDAKEIGFLKSS